MDRIHSLEQEIAEIRKVLYNKEKELYSLRKQWIPLPQANRPQVDQVEILSNNSRIQIDRLPKWAIERYSRQILLPDIGVLGQEQICSSRVLIVGAGGLGCPAAVYLAGAGVGDIGLVDYDTVELSNIHRQILHSETEQHMNKVDSAANYLRSINSKITITPYKIQIDSTNAIEIASKYDVILDCSDNVPTRYLLNDVAVLTKKPLISGSALKMEGQLTIYGYRGENNSNEKEPFQGPCYRCMFPTPPPPETVGSCSANGVLGPVPGVIGALQALEAIKHIVGHTHDKLLVGRMLIFDGEDTTFRNVKLRSRNPDCPACSKCPTITQLLDYEVFCRAQAKEKKLLQSKLNPTKCRRIEEKTRRMNGQRYLGLRVAENHGTRRWVMDVPKTERKIGARCSSGLCGKGLRRCEQIDDSARQEIFTYFWHRLDWEAKKKYVKSLIDIVPPKRRRIRHKGETSRKGDSKLYHLRNGESRLQVCKIMFLSTLGIKDAMVRWWLSNENTPKTPRKPLKALNVESYIDSLHKYPPQCALCRTTSNVQYIGDGKDGVKNVFQLYKKYQLDSKLKGEIPASRKTFYKVYSNRNLKIFKPKNDTDVCDLVTLHNTIPIDTSLDLYQELDTAPPVDKDTELIQNNEDLNLQILPPEHRITASETAKKLQEQRHLLVDVRNEHEFRMCRIDGAVNYPIDGLTGDKMAALKRQVEQCDGLAIFVCRRGNDSQVVAQRLLDVMDATHAHRIVDMTGGLHAWARNVDEEFPVY